MVEYVLISYDISIQSNWGDLTMCIKQPTIKRWRINWGVMVDRQMPFDDKVSKLNNFSREPLLLRLCLQLGLLIHTLHWLWFGGTTWAPHTHICFDFGVFGNDRLIDVWCRCSWVWLWNQLWLSPWIGSGYCAMVVVKEVLLVKSLLGSVDDPVWSSLQLVWPHS